MADATPQENDPDQISAAPNRIRYAQDVEAQRRRSLRRRASNASDLSARTSRSFARHEVEPGVALPIHFRTLSFNVEQTQAKEVEEAELKEKEKAKAKKKFDAEFGKPSYLLLCPFCLDALTVQTTPPSTGTRSRPRSCALAFRPRSNRVCRPMEPLASSRNTDPTRPRRLPRHGFADSSDTSSVASAPSS